MYIHIHFYAYVYIDQHIFLHMHAYILLHSRIYILIHIHNYYTFTITDVCTQGDYLCSRRHLCVVWLQCDTMTCSMMQCVADKTGAGVVQDACAVCCCSVMRCVAVCCSVLQYDAVYCRQEGRSCCRGRMCSMLL